MTPTARARFRRNSCGNGIVVAVESRSGAYAKSRAQSERKHIKDGALLKEGKKKAQERDGEVESKRLFFPRVARGLLASRTLSVHTPYTLE